MTDHRRFPVSVVLVGVQLDQPLRTDPPELYERLTRLVPAFQSKTIWPRPEQSAAVDFSNREFVARGWTLHVVGSALIEKVLIDGRLVVFEGSSPVVIVSSILKPAQDVHVELRSFGPVDDRPPLNQLAIAHYRQELSNLVKARDAAGGSLDEAEEGRRLALIDDCWNGMTSDEQDEAERQDGEP